MTALNVDAATPLKGLIQQASSDVSIYVNGGLPTTGLPTAFLLIEPNGGIRTEATKFANATCVLSVSVYTKLLSTGATNMTLENLTIGKFQDLFDDVVSVNEFTYELMTNPVMYSGKSLISGYSTKIINVNCFINY